MIIKPAHSHNDMIKTVVAAIKEKYNDIKKKNI